MTRFGGSAMKRGRLAALVIIASAFFVTAASGFAAESRGRGACRTIQTLSPSACGFTIGRSGCYETTTGVAASGGGDCIMIAAPNVFLNLTGVTISGTGAGTGLHVKSKGAMIVGGQISGFEVGILAESKVLLEEPDVQHNSGDGIQLSGAGLSKIMGGTSSSNGGNGVTISGSKSFSVITFEASGNTGSGIMVSGSRAGNISSLTALGNGAYGVEVIGSIKTKIIATHVDLNGIYGVYLKASSGNEVSSPDGTIHCNGRIDVYLGCSDTDGPDGTACRIPSSANVIDNVTVFGTNVNPYGIVIDLGNTGNKVRDSNASTDTVYDMYDANEADQNLWSGNTFTTANQSYIH